MQKIYTITNAEYYTLSFDYFFLVKADNKDEAWKKFRQKYLDAENMYAEDSNRKVLTRDNFYVDEIKDLFGGGDFVNIF